MGEVVVASYNMSFLSDMTLSLDKIQRPSEVTFLTSNTSGERRKYWENAKELLRKFIMMTTKNKKLPFVIGLQEMNLTKEGSNTGSDAITQMLSKTIHNTEFEHICREVTSGDTKPALSIIYDKTTFGKAIQVRILDNWCQAGRPLLMILTELGYVFANMHGAQNPDDGNPYQGGTQRKFNESIIRINKRFLENSLEEFLKCHGFSKENRPTGIFITGDFNDRYDAIEEFNIFGIRLRYNGESPYSCCHNWDSSCSDKNFNLLKNFKDKNVREYFSKREKQGDYYCELPDKDIQFDKNGKKLAMPPEESEIQLYRYKGDKVFAEIDDDDEKDESYGEIEMFNHFRRHWKPSQESDHELVYAKFPYKNKQYIIPGELRNIVPGIADVEYEYIDESDPDLTRKIKGYTLYKEQSFNDVEKKYSEPMWELTFRNKNPEDKRPLYKILFLNDKHFKELKPITSGGKRRKTRQYKRKNSRKTRRHR